MAGGGAPVRAQAIFTTWGWLFSMKSLKQLLSIKGGDVFSIAPDANPYMAIYSILRTGLEGPLAAVVATPFAVVVGTTAKDARMREIIQTHAESFAQQWLQWQRQPLRMLRDTEVTAEHEQTYSLILLGGADANAITRKIARQLPFSASRNGIVVDEREWQVKDSVLQAIYPSPLAADRYVYVVAATSPEGMYFWKPQLVHFTFGYPLAPSDWMIQDGRRPPPGTANVSIANVAAGIFDSSWRRRRPFETTIDKGVVIDGWWQAIPGMRVGGRRQILVPPALGFTQRGLAAARPAPGVEGATNRRSTDARGRRCSRLGLRGLGLPARPPKRHVLPVRGRHLHVGVLRVFHAEPIGIGSLLELAFQVVGEAEVIVDVRLERARRDVHRVRLPVRLDLVGLTRASTQAGGPRSVTTAAVMPRISEPRTLTLKVPQGTTLSCLDWTNRSVR